MISHSDIMIVDDNPSNLKLLEDMLHLRGHEVRSFPLGRLALAAASKNPPDLILLDVNMPEMDGYEVCKRLKSSQEVAHVPVIFLSALNETPDKVKAFKSGAVDYISKPFQLEEVHARVQTHLDLHHLQQALTQQNEHLEEAVALRTRQLAEANARLTILDRSKSDFLSLISHEFRTPLNGLFGVSEIILEEIDDSAKTHQLKHLYQQCRHRILSILDDALLLTEIDMDAERFRPAPASLHLALSRSIEKTAQFAQSRRVLLPQVADLQPFEGDRVVGNNDMLVRALHALLETAVKFSEPGRAVRILRDWAPDLMKIVIESSGRSIPEAALAKFFDILAIREAITPGGDLGLGPAMAHRILALFDAPAGVMNRENGPGVRLSVSFRAAPPT